MAEDHSGFKLLGDVDVNSKNMTNLNQVGGFTLTGNVDVNSKNMTNAVDPTNAQDVATKNYVDTADDLLLPKSSLLAPNNYFGSLKLFQPETTNILFAGDKRFTVTQTGCSTWNPARLFSNNYEHNNAARITASGTGVISIDLIAKGEYSVTGQTYPIGYVLINCYHTYIASSVSGRIKDKDGNWHNMAYIGNISSYSGGAIYKLSLPSNYYMVEIELTINAPAGNDVWICEIEYHGLRPDGARFGAFNKYAAERLYYKTYWKDSTNTTKAYIDTAGNIKGTQYKVDALTGASGSFTTSDGKTVTVTKGIITSIV